MHDLRCMRVEVLLAIGWLAGAPQARRLSLEHGSRSVSSNSTVGTHDVLSILGAREGKDARCCCDVANGIRRCMVEFLKPRGLFGGTKKCKDISKPPWAKSKHKLGHYRHTGKTCELADEDLPEFLSKLGTGEGYCRYEHSERKKPVTLAKLGDVLTPICAAGWQAAGEVTCTYASLTAGKYQPEPRCELKKDYCKTVSGARFASLGEVVDVDCGPRVLSWHSPAQVTCHGIGEEGYFKPKPECYKETGKEVLQCKRGVHTYLHFADGGCFGHMDSFGKFLSKEDAFAYQQKLCPFSQDNIESRLRRALFGWYRTYAFGCYIHLDRSNDDGDTHYGTYKSRECPLSDKPQFARELRRKLMQYRHEEELDIELVEEAETSQADLELAKDEQERDDKLDQKVAPFSVTDLAMTCTLGEPSKFQWRKEEIQVYLQSAEEDEFQQVVAKMLEPQELCSTFLQLPLMWDWIGWDWKGLMWEDSSVRTVYSFYGRVIKLGRLRKGDLKHCQEKGKGMGDAAHGRLALRALLPTYFRHNYVESNGEVVTYGSYHATYIGKFDSSKYAHPIAEVCRKASGLSHGGFDELLSFKRMQWGDLRSLEALKRDKDKCHSNFPCDYSKCNICSEGEPCFDPVQRSCHPAVGGICLGSRVDLFHSQDNCQADEAKSCRCHKAVCWYFTSDFRAALSALHKNGQESGDCKDLVSLDTVGVSQGEADAILEALRTS